MSELQDILRQLDTLISQRSDKDEAIKLVVRALHSIASDHHTLKSKVGSAPFSTGSADPAIKGAVGG
jgi:20S proteasome alpha/beta subunit